MDRDSCEENNTNELSLNQSIQLNYVNSMFLRFLLSTLNGYTIH